MYGQKYLLALNKINSLVVATQHQLHELLMKKKINKVNKKRVFLIIYIFLYCNRLLKEIDEYY